MGKIWAEICLISARGLTRTSSLWKLQWFAVGWINPDNKYCTKVDASGNANPVWKTKFSVLIDNSDPDFKDLALHVEVYSREPIFLREKLQGTATVVLKEFLDKYSKNSEVSKPVEEVGSFQLRKKNSNKPQGFVDVSIRISEEKEEYDSYQGDEAGINLRPLNAGINLPPSTGWPENQPPPTSSPYDYPQPTPTNYSTGGEVGIKLRTRNNDMNVPPSTGQGGNHLQSNSAYDYPLTTPTNYSTGGEVGIKLRTRNNGMNLPPSTGQGGNHLQSNPAYDYHLTTQTNYSSGRPNYPSAGGSSYQLQQTLQQPPGSCYQAPRTPPPLPPPSNVGYIPNFLSGTNNGPPSYINMPSSSGGGTGRSNAPGFAMGLGAGALAAGAVIFGEDFMSAFDLPSGLHNSSVTISTDPPF